ncbi:MAG: hypothetical protein CMH49_02500 [Myxococcales bacterium]|nr:hypothetical protein [Myxococcales bacterium]
MQTPKPSFYTIFLLFAFGYGCTPTYQSSRTYIPQHTEAKQLQVELGASQADVSYSITDHVQVNVGGLYTTSQNESSEGDADSQSKRTETSTLSGGHLGLGFFTALGSSKDKVFSVNVGSAIQNWDFTREGDSLTLDLGYDNFNASIVNPYAQVAFMLGKPTSNVSFGLRYERPMFDFEDLNGAPLEDNSDPSLLNYIIHSKFEITDGLSLFGQFIFRDNLASDSMDLNQYDVSSWNIYVGLSYAIGFAEQEESSPNNGVEVQHTEK